tara:strand:+ start:620 stop:1072 length:453 start_codon:yes stop_codon:yes gene_type:complete
MKSTRTRSLRGSILPTDGYIKKQLILSDGLINHGLKIRYFTMWTSSGQNEAGIDAVLSLDVISTAGNIMDASNSRQIAWVTGGYDNGIQTMSYREIIDPDHVVNRDLYLSAQATDGELWNYLIICDAYELSDDEAIVQIIKETQQSVGSD